MDNFKIMGMTDAVCAGNIEKAVLRVAGVTECEVNLDTDSMVVHGTANPETVIKAVRQAGYKARLILNDNSHKPYSSDSDDINNIDDESDCSHSSYFGAVKMAKRLIISFIILLVLMYFSTGRRILGYQLPSVFTENSALLFSVEIILSLAVIIVCRHIFISGVSSILHKQPNMDALVSLGSLAAFGYSTIVSLYAIIYYGNMGEYIGQSDIYFETSSMILTLVSVGKLIEELARGKTTDAINSLLDLTPKTAILLIDGAEKEVPIETVKVGDTFILKPGMKIPVDGIVKMGTSAVDESSLTGESIPVDKEIGMTVSAATINLSGHLTCMATSVGDNTVFSQIIQMVTDSATGKAKTETPYTRLSTLFISAVILLSVITFICWIFTDFGVGFAISRAVAVLIISCPCAMGLASPIAIMAGNSVGAKNGILFKNPLALERAGKTQIVVLDKTGTITTGKPKVTDIISTIDDAEHRDLLLTIAYSLEIKSEHPLAKAICEYAEKRYITPLRTKNFTLTAGKGICAELMLNNRPHWVYAGNESYIAEMMLGENPDDDAHNLFDSEFTSIINDFSNNGKIPLIFATKNGLLGIIAVADEINETAVDAVSTLYENNIHVVMVTGDRQATAQSVAEEVGINQDEVLSGILPKDKAEIVEKLKENGTVAMIGDGINDAPALTCADIGIAIGAGTDVAIDAADIVLLQNKLISAVDAILLSQRTARIIEQNLLWSCIYNIIGIPIAAGCFYLAFGWLLDPIFCAVAMSASSFLVVLNALRLLKYESVILK